MKIASLEGGDSCLSPSSKRRRSPPPVDPIKCLDHHEIDRVAHTL